MFIAINSHIEVTLKPPFPTQVLDGVDGDLFVSDDGGCREAVRAALWATFALDDEAAFAAVGVDAAWVSDVGDAESTASSSALEVPFELAFNYSSTGNASDARDALVAEVAAQLEVAASDGSFQAALGEGVLQQDVAGCARGDPPGYLGVSCGQLVGAEIDGVASMGTFENGVFDYGDLVQNYVGQGDWVRSVDSESMVPWLYSSSLQTFISYDDEESIQHKLDYILAEDLGGMMFWELSGDDDQHTLVHQMASELRPSSP